MNLLRQFFVDLLCELCEVASDLLPCGVRAVIELDDVFVAPFRVTGKFESINEGKRTFTCPSCPE